MLQDFKATDTGKSCCSNKRLGGKDSCRSLSRKEKMCSNFHLRIYLRRGWAIKILEVI